MNIGAALAVMNQVETLGIEDVIAPPVRARRRIDDELLRSVARIYRANIRHAPTGAVARTFGVRQRMASVYVDRARERGFLPPTTQGRKLI